MEAKYRKIVRFEVTVKCTQPMHVGSGETDGSVLVREDDGVPFIQGTSLAGAFHSYIETTKGTETAGELFGSWDSEQNRNRKSRIVFSEGNFAVGTLRMEMRTRVSINGATGSVSKKKLKGTEKSSGQVLDMEYISAGSQFSFLIYLFDGDDSSVKESLAAMNRGILTLGGMSTIGCGKTKLVRVTEKLYDMEKQEDRDSWGRRKVGEICGDGTDITEEIRGLCAESPYYELTAGIRLRTPLLIRANETDPAVAAELLHLKIVDGVPEGMPDAMPIMNGQPEREFVIPGSSLKGVFRSRMEMIADYLGLDPSVMQSVFENRSLCLFEDAVLRGPREDGKVNRQPRIHINKISGGVMDKMLFSEMTIGGETKLHIRVAKGSRKENAPEPMAILGLLLYVLRDFQIGAVTLGSGSGIGRGYLEIGKVELTDSEQLRETFSMRNLSGQRNFADRCVTALQKTAGEGRRV